MKHHLKTEDGKFKITISIGCNGECDKCKYSIASCTIPEMDQLLKLAKCLKLQ